MKALIILNHVLTADQKSELREQHGADLINTLTPEQKVIWGQIPAEGTREDVACHVRPILDLIEDVDMVVCQGEFTAFSLMLEACNLRNTPLLVACSQRETVEKISVDGSAEKVSLFRHVQFRQVNGADNSFYRLHGQCQDVGGSPTSLTFRNIKDAIQEVMYPTSNVDWSSLENSDGEKIPLPQWCQYAGLWCPVYNPSSECCSGCGR